MLNNNQNILKIILRMYRKCYYTGIFCDHLKYLQQLVFEL